MGNSGILHLHVLLWAMGLFPVQFLRMLAADTLIIAHTCAAPAPIILAATPAACAGFLWTAQQGAMGHQQDAHSTLKQTNKYEREELNS